MMHRVLFPFLALLMLATPAHAEDFETANALYMAGDYDRAIEIAEALETADGYALAARAMILAHAFDPPSDERAKLLDRSIVLSEKALAIDPDHVEGNLQYAASIGYLGRQSRSVKLARTAKKHMERALAVNPDSAWANISYGAWNGEVIYEAGAFLGGAVLGARRSKFTQHFERAFELDPESLVFRLHHAGLLLRMNRKKYATQARESLLLATQMEPRNAFEELHVEFVAELLKRLDATDLKKKKSKEYRELEMHLQKIRPYIPEKDMAELREMEEEG